MISWTAGPVGESHGYRTGYSGIRDSLDPLDRRGQRGSRGTGDRPFIFRSSTPSAKLLQHLSVIDFKQEPAGSDYKVKFSLNLAKDDQVSLIAVVVNASDAVERALAGSPADAEKQELLKALTFSTSKDKDDTYKWNVNPPGIYAGSHVRRDGYGRSRAGLSCLRLLDPDAGSCGRGKQG